jgi:uncharacterized repeat protein (TIGR04138 family)
MSQHHKPQKAKSCDVDWSKVLNAAGPYPLEAFNFVREGLAYTADRIMAERETVAGDDRHINGQQLCLGLRDFAIQQYGMLAPIVMRHWHVRRTDDFGRIVFALIAEGLMSKNDDDSLDDFRSVYDFDEAFSQDQLIGNLAAEPNPA